LRSGGETGQQSNILIAGIALAHHAPVIITADTNLTAIAKYADIDALAYRR